MILDHIDNIDRYHDLPNRLYRALQALTPELCAMGPGRYDLDGENLYAMIQEYETRPRDTGKWEAHRKYVDVQYMIAGAETMGIAYEPALMVTEPYDAAKDVGFYSGEGSYVDVHAGFYAIFFPTDAHAPCLAVEHPAPIKKVVLKVLAE